MEKQYSRISEELRSLRCVWWKQIFFWYFLTDNVNVREYYASLVIAARESGSLLRWKQVCESFATIFASFTKYVGSSNRLGALKLDNVWE